MSQLPGVAIENQNRFPALLETCTGAMQAAQRFPGAIRLGVGQAGSISHQWAKLLSATPVPGTNIPEPKPCPNDCVMLAAFPSSSTAERCVVKPSMLPGRTIC